MRGEAQLLADQIVLEAFLSGKHPLQKQAGAMDMLDSVKNELVSYFRSQYDENRPAASILNLVTPALLVKIGGPLSWLGWLLLFAQTVFGLDLRGVFQSIIDGVKGLVGGDEGTTKVSPDKVREVTKQAIDQFLYHYTNSSPIPNSSATARPTAATV